MNFQKWNFRKVGNGFLGALVLFAACSATAATFKVETLQAQLKKQNATWTPKDSWVNQLPQQEIKKLLGYKGHVRYGKDVTFLAADFATGTGTDSIDWRNKDGQNWVSPILNQANCGSCVAFSAVGTLETQVNISRNLPWLNAHFSPQALFACGGGGCDTGWMPASAANYLKNKGVPDEACAPYTMGATGQDVSCGSICADSKNRVQKISAIRTPHGAAAVKAALKKGPLMTTLDVYADFLVYGSGIYKHTTGEMEGGHAVSIVGFNDAEGYWLVRNSWGPDWGENGFVRVAYSDTSGVGDEVWGFDLPNVNGVVSVNNVHDNQYFTSPVTITAVSTIDKTQNVQITIVDSQGRKQTSTPCLGGTCTSTGQLADGRYEVYAEAVASGPKVTSERKYFYVVNSEPKLSLNFMPVSGLDLSKPVKDRIEFNIVSQSSSVPFTSLQFLVKQDGKVIYTKSADIVLAKMTMGWRTPIVPNGTYEISLVGTIKSDSLTYQAVSNSYSVTVQN